MNTRKDYTLYGLSNDVQFGKKGGRIIHTNSGFEFYDAAGTSRIHIKVPLIPQSPNDAISLDFLESLINDLPVSNVSNVASTNNETLSNIMEGYIVDGVILLDGNRVLLKNQNNLVENGEYEVTITGPVRTSTPMVQNTIISVNGGIMNGTRKFVVASSGVTDVDSIVILEYPLPAKNTVISSLKVPVSYSDSIISLGSFPANSTIKTITVSNPVSWNGDLSIGIAADNSLLASINQIDLNVIGKTIINTSFSMPDIYQVFAYLNSSDVLGECTIKIEYIV